MKCVKGHVSTVNAKARNMDIEQDVFMKVLTETGSVAPSAILYLPPSPPVCPLPPLPPTDLAYL